MTIFTDLDLKIKESRQNRDKFQVGSWGWISNNIRVDALQDLRKKSLGRYLADPNHDKLVFIEIEPPNVSVKVTKTLEVQD